MNRAALTRYVQKRNVRCPVRWQVREPGTERLYAVAFVGKRRATVTISRCKEGAVFGFDSMTYKSGSWVVDEPWMISEKAADVFAAAEAFLTARPTTRA